MVGGTPDLQSAAIGSGAVRDFEGHLYVGTSSWLTCHVPFKKTDLFHGIASLPSPLPGKYYVADEQEVAGASLNWLRDSIIFPDDALRQTTTPDDFFPLLDDVAATSPAGSNGVIFTPWLNGERTPVDDHRLRGGWHDLSLQTTRADLVRSVLEGVAYNSRWLLGCVEKFTGQPFPALNFIGGGAQSRLWCRIMADVLDRPIRQVEHPIRANVRRRGRDRVDRARAHHRRRRGAGRQGRRDVRARPVDEARVRRAVSRVPGDSQTDQRHLREVARPCLKRPTEDVPMRGWGLPLPGELDRVVIVSPHLDDAVLGCGNFMAAHPGAVVVTVFAGQSARIPHEPDAQVGRAVGLRAR